MRVIPFYANHPDNMHCSQAVFRSLFNFLLDEELSWEEIDEISKTILGKGSWTMAAHIELARRGVEIINIEPFDYEAFYNQGQHYLDRHFDEETIDYYIEKSNLLSVREYIPQFLKVVKHESRKATISDIDNLLNKRFLVGAEINSRVLNNTPGFSLHYVLIKRAEGENYLINDPGGGSSPAIESRLIPKSEFVKALGDERTNGEVSGFRLKAIRKGDR